MSEGTGSPSAAAVIAFALSVLIWSLVFVQSWTTVRGEPGGDLRNRVVGARRMIAGIDPYASPSVKLPEFYRTFTPTTASPAHLLLYVPLAKLTYSTQRWFYFAQDWLFLVLVLLLLQAMCSMVAPSWVFLAYSLLVVVDISLLMHFARGQLYIELVLLTAIVAYALVRGKTGWWGPIALALLVLLRPTYLLVVIGVVLLGAWGFVRRATIALAIMAVLAIAFTGVGTWREYASMLKQASADHVAITTGTWNVAKVDPVIEGRDYSKFRSFGGWEADRTFIGLFGFRGLQKVVLSHQRALILVNAVLLVLSVAVMLGVLRKMRGHVIEVEHVGLLVLIPIIAETFGPQRYAYADLLLAVPLVLAVTLVWRDSRSPWVIAAAVLYAAISRVYPGRVVSVARFGIVVLAIVVVFVSRLQESRAMKTVTR